ncbi:MAG: GspE/PulE family protein [Phycisphaerae bacterium]
MTQYNTPGDHAAGSNTAGRNTTGRNTAGPTTPAAPTTPRGAARTGEAAVEPRTQMIDVSKLPPETAVERLIEHAVAMGSSDLFLCTNEEHVAVQVRHLGIIRPISVETSDRGRRMLSHIRAASGTEVSEKRRPHDGRWIYETDAGESVDLRISVIPTMYGEDIGLRLLPRDRGLMSLGDIGMTKKQQGVFEGMISSPSGLILITGPTGSGKTATLYSALQKLNDGQRKVNTIEDPVEYVVPGLRQSQVNPAIDLGFSDLLRAVLRQNPDVIMIGEIRDADTAQTAVRAANSGIIVLATLHAPSAAAAIQSMRAYDVHPHFLSTSLRGVVGQRLVRTLDPASRREFDLSDATHTFDDIRDMLSPGEGNVLYAPGPTEANQMTGYSGRTGVFEVLPVSRAIRQMIADGLPARNIHERAVQEGMLEFRKAALLAVARGYTSTEEVTRVVPAEALLLED